ncbi:similar to Saccharomyces cerevisiae YNL282W POP3 Subunit of both RNase MRP and nuclear RNase P [Maudiozyma barnettii]|uniref:Similar to Saccharomyces cerevisiae YNL282W POP3 Subunit of both RNase MRP and nuclear RNase P n=1 Tax=Maudiozyma barnettii TaxID=61262 RepID=A0A8H2VDQ2_9SACH|nr:Pop3p [Kazachstania barnettii]CAB4253580.1 similar to Saccharomyces cerevisiae YNL282W POP3 Subunit of both RNase MRP and nuclear RNase P [Kazachstania barnettii]CAD1781254.1 similar to Saccharomyces cerevisiae YNL282W POP3 Subunit of both RNase MRP and nuclear RNase P [Kazachstania barnettii]
MSSLKAIDKRIAKRRQVYKAVLSNPFVNEEQIWPHVKNQQLVQELLQKHVLNKVQHLQQMKVAKEEWPFDLITDFNKIYAYLEQNEPEQAKEALLFVCNKDQDVPLVMLQQIPLMSYISSTQTTLVQLPKGSLGNIQKFIDLPYGILLLPAEHLDPVFLQQIHEQVAKQIVPWLAPLKYKSTDVKLAKSSAPLK